jgi:Trk-type K+ transport system membrane component
VHIAGELAERAEAAARPLGLLGKTVAFLLGLLGFPLLFFLIGDVTFRERGEYRKKRAMWMLGFLGLGTGVVLFVFLRVTAIGGFTLCGDGPCVA